ILSPIDGVVKSLRHHTIGGVVRPGEPLMEIVPTQERLVVEAKLDPTDIGYVSVGQAATVKVSTYEFTRYGGLEGVVKSISADSHVDPSTGQTFFKVIAETDKTYLGANPGELPIAPGMEATVDIHTGSKSVLDYLLKPVIRAQSESFRER
ncbi:MAG: HlyD family efflux transporter periplasmic adaptor subunit, partial [Proteobacteria bacterium]|nr:HlyD family efflux transporter periplasmic adaptor subunit [Pseudomonadota bacterium]